MTSATQAQQRTEAGSRFIVKFRDGSEAARDKEAARQWLEAHAPEGVALSWQRRLAVQADLFTSSRPLDAEEAATLIQRFRAHPDVEYIEADGRVGIDPVRPDALPRRGD